jgi:hypothetical protein
MKINLLNCPEIKKIYDGLTKMENNIEVEEKVLNIIAVCAIVSFLAFFIFQMSTIF